MGCYGSVKCKKSIVKRSRLRRRVENQFSAACFVHIHTILRDREVGQRNREEALNINNKEQNETNKKINKTGLATFRSTFTLYRPTDRRAAPLQALLYCRRAGLGGGERRMVKQRKKKKQRANESYTVENDDNDDDEEGGQLQVFRIV